MDRRRYLQHVTGLLAGSAFAWSRRGAAAVPLVIRLNIPGPRSLPFLPLELIPPLGIDAALGTRLSLRYFTSGVLAFEDMMAGNASFAGHGFAILPGMKRKGKEALAIAPIAGSSAALSLVVRADLAGKIKQVGELKFRSIGASSGTPNSRTYQQMLAGQMLALHGIASTEVRWVQTGQNWESVRSVLAAKSVDAVLCEEPFASRAVDAGLARYLYSVDELYAARPDLGGNHIRAVISTPRDTDNTEQAALLVDMVRHSLQWLAAARPADVISKLSFNDPDERRALQQVLGRFANIFSSEPSFSKQAIAATVTLLKELNSISNADDVESLIDDRWAGRRP